MTDNPAPSGLQYVVIDGDALDYYPPNVRRAAELLMTYLEGLKAGRSLGAGDAASIRRRVDDVSRAAAASADKIGNLSACGAIYGVTGGDSGADGTDSDGDFVVVFGPGAAAAVAKLP